MNRFGLLRHVSEGFGGGRGDYSHPLLADPGDMDVLRALLEVAIRGARRDGALVLANVPEDGGWAERIRSTLRTLGVTHAESTRRCLQIRLPESFADYRASVRSRLRTDIGRRLRRLEDEVGPVHFERILDPERAKNLLPVLFEMHDRRWVEAGRPGAFSDPAMRAYFEGMVHTLWPHLHVTVLRVKDRPIAIHWGMTMGSSLLHFKPTFDAKLHPYSPGKIHLWKLIEQSIQEGLDTFDFLQGEEGYKSEWATGETETTTFVIQTRAGALTYWWLTRGRMLTEKRFGRIYLKIAAGLDRLRGRG